jgi:antitoxin YefM
MEVINYSDTRERLKEVMDRVVADHQPVVISRQKAESVVMVSLADWHAIEETLHLLSSPAAPSANSSKARFCVSSSQPAPGKTISIGKPPTRKCCRV